MLWLELFGLIAGGLAVVLARAVLTPERLVAIVVVLACAPLVAAVALVVWGKLQSRAVHPR